MNAGVKINGQYYREILVKNFCLTSKNSWITSPFNKIQHLLSRRSIRSRARHQTTTTRLHPAVTATSTKSIR